MRTLVRGGFWSAALVAILTPAHAQPVDAPATVTGLTASQLFDFAANAEQGGDTATAEQVYATLASDPDIDVRAEARFRHGKLLSGQGKFADAAVLFRAILDEKPDARPVRLELAGILARLGNLRGASRELRHAQAGGLPQEVAQLVDQYSAALRSVRPYGASFELSLAPSTNINRATDATTLDTIIAPLDLSEDARATSGLGIRIGGQGFARLPLSPKVSVSLRLSMLSNLYRESRFHDAVAAGQIGAEAQLGKTRTKLFGGRSYRWFGQELFATTDSVSVGLQRPVGRKAQLELELGAGRADYRLNSLQDGWLYDASLTYERAFSQRMGGSIALSTQRQTARDPGYASWQAGATFLVYRELGKTTAYVSAGLFRLEGDERLFLFPDRRKEWLTRLGAGATFRQIKISGFSPLVRLSWERNRSTVGLYAYRRLGGELGIVRAF